jgi:hypothetical protein
MTPWFIVAVALAGCAARQASSPGRNAGHSEVADRRIANLERAAQYPWLDDGVCAVREASGEWRDLVERCYHALDLSRIQFQDVQHRCTVASVDAATMGPLVGMCLLVQPEIVVGAIIVIGVVVVAAAIAAELADRGCYCRCFNKGVGPLPLGRRANPVACWEECKEAHFTGFQCGGAVTWP